MNTVSSASITGMVVSLILCVAAPVALCVLLKRKTGAKLSDMLLGAVTFVIFAMFLEQMLHLAMSAVFGEKLTGNLWLSALYGGAAAAVFEEFGRLVAMKYFLGSQLEKENALMYGVGHGGIEALFVGGLTCVSNLATVSMVNGGKLESALAGLDEAARATSMATVSQLWTLPSYLFTWSAWSGSLRLLCKSACRIWCTAPSGITAGASSSLPWASTSPWTPWPCCSRTPSPSPLWRPFWRSSSS